MQQLEGLGEEDALVKRTSEVPKRFQNVGGGYYPSKEKVGFPKAYTYFFKLSNAHEVLSEYVEMQRRS